VQHNPKNQGKEKRIIMDKIHAIPFLRSLLHEPASNFHYLPRDGERVMKTNESVVTELYSNMESESFDDACLASIFKRRYVRRK